MEQPDILQIALKQSEIARERALELRRQADRLLGREPEYPEPIEENSESATATST